MLNTVVIISLVVIILVLSLLLIKSKEVRYKDAQLWHILNTCPYQWIVWDHDYFFTSKKITSLLNIPVTSLEDLYKTIDHEFQEAINERIQQLERIYKPFTLNVRLVSNSKRIDIEGTFLIRDKKPLYILWLAYSDEDSNLYKDALNSLNHAIWIKRDRQILFCNEASNKMYGSHLPLGHHLSHQNKPLDIVVETINNDAQVFCATDNTKFEQLKLDLEKQMLLICELLSKLPMAVAVFDNTLSLQHYNNAYKNMYALEETFLAQHPNLEMILDELYPKRMLPELTDFNSYKLQQLKLVRKNSNRIQELHHLVNGKSLRVQVFAIASFGQMMIIEDISNILDLERQRNALQITQTDLINNLSIGLALLQNNGRTKTINKAMMNILSLTSNHNTSVQIVVDSIISKYNFKYQGNSPRNSLLKLIKERIKANVPLYTKDGAQRHIGVLEYLPTSDGAHAIFIYDSSLLPTSWHSSVMHLFTSFFETCYRSFHPLLEDILFFVNNIQNELKESSEVVQEQVAYLDKIMRHLISKNVMVRHLVSNKEIQANLMINLKDLILGVIQDKEMIMTSKSSTIIFPEASDVYIQHESELIFDLLVFMLDLLISFISVKSIISFMLKQDSNETVISITSLSEKSELTLLAHLANITLLEGNVNFFNLMYKARGIFVVYEDLEHTQTKIHIHLLDRLKDLGV